MRDRLQEWYIKHFYRLYIWLGRFWITLWNNLAVTSSNDHFEVERETVGAFHLAQNSGNFGKKWNGVDHFGSVWPEYLGPPLKVVHFDWPGHFGRKKMKCPFSFDKIVVLLYPAYKNNNQTCGGLGQVCAIGMYRSIGHVEFPKFQTGIFVERKAPRVKVWASLK